MFTELYHLGALLSSSYFITPSVIHDQDAFPTWIPPLRRAEATSGSPNGGGSVLELTQHPHQMNKFDVVASFLHPYESVTLAFAQLGMGDSHIANLDRCDLSENRRKWSEVGCPNRDGARSASVPEGRIEVKVINEALCMEMGALNFVREG